MAKLPSSPWDVAVQNATWDENGDVVLLIKVTLPQKTITKPESLAVEEFIAQASVQRKDVL